TAIPATEPSGCFQTRTSSTSPLPIRYSESRTVSLIGRSENAGDACAQIWAAGGGPLKSKIATMVTDFIANSRFSKQCAAQVYYTNEPGPDSLDSRGGNGPVREGDAHGRIRKGLGSNVQIAPAWQQPRVA